MSESDSFITEVSEEVRRDKLFAFLRRWGWALGLAILAIVGGTAFIEWQKHQREQAAQVSGDAIRSALDLADPAARAEALATLAEGDSGAPLVARFARAGSLVEAGEAAAAGEALAKIAADPHAPELYRSLARLQRVMVLGDALDPSERLAALDTLTVADSPFRAIGLEQRALVHLETGDTPRATEDLRAVLLDPGASDAQQGRVQQLLVAIGGDVLPEAAGNAPVPVPADG